MSKKKKFDADSIEYTKKYKSPLIKWYTTNISNEDKLRLGLMTYPEYVAWQQELMKEAAGAAGSNTFWKDDTEVRENMSTDDYESFLSQNSIDVSNRTAVDFDALAASLQSGGGVTEAASADAAPADVADMDAILASVNRDIHGGATLLSQEEIDALFNANNS